MIIGYSLLASAGSRIARRTNGWKQSPYKAFFLYFVNSAYKSNILVYSLYIYFVIDPPIYFLPTYPVSVWYSTGWDPEPVWFCCRRRTSLCLRRIEMYSAIHSQSCYRPFNMSWVHRENSCRGTCCCRCDIRGASVSVRDAEMPKFVSRTNFNNQPAWRQTDRLAQHFPLGQGELVFCLAHSIWYYLLRISECWLHEAGC